MRIIFFNIWHGQVWDGLKDFLLSESAKTDVFCFMEVDPKVQAKLESILSDYSTFYYKGIKTVYLDEVMEGRCIFVKKGIDILESENIYLFEASPEDAGGMQYVKLNIKGKLLHIGSVHGKARPGTKRDTPVRLKQSQIIVDFFKNKEGPKVIGGDFNLYPGTKSIAMIGDAGYTNLIKEFGIKNTRNRLSWEQFGNTHQHFADFTFVSPEIKVIKFEVPHNEISDHLPQVLDFEI